MRGTDKDLVLTTKVDGREVTLTLYPRTYTTYRDYNKKPRLYIHYDETLFDNLVNRTSRPSRLITKTVRAALANLGLGGTVHWSQRAGCSCPCSPGLIWTDAPHPEGAAYRFDVVVKVEALPEVEVSPRALANQRARAEAVLNDPTLAPLLVGADA
jgi:hypothetical protein